MKSLSIALISILVVSLWFSTTQSMIADDNNVQQQSWKQYLLDKEGKSINSDDYLFYRTGHHGILWSLIASDSSKIYLYNGTTRSHIEYAYHSSLDTSSFIENNIKTIKWGLDSLSNTAKLLTQLKSESYNPIYTELNIVKNNKIIFCHNNADSYTGEDSVKFRYNLGKLIYLMYWLSAPASRQYLPAPCDTLSAD